MVGGEVVLVDLDAALDAGPRPGQVALARWISARFE